MLLVHHANLIQLGQNLIWQFWQLLILNCENEEMMLPNLDLGFTQK